MKRQLKFDRKTSVIPEEDLSSFKFEMRDGGPCFTGGINHRLEKGARKVTYEFPSYEVEIKQKDNTPISEEMVINDLNTSAKVLYGRGGLLDLIATNDNNHSLVESINPRNNLVRGEPVAYRGKLKTGFLRPLHTVEGNIHLPVHKVVECPFGIDSVEWSLALAPSIERPYELETVTFNTPSLEPINNRFLDNLVKRLELSNIAVQRHADANVSFRPSLYVED